MEIKHTNTKDLENAIKIILAAFDDPLREGLIQTPQRVVKSYLELLRSEEPKITIFDSNGYDQMIVDKDICYYTFCEHHLLPFFGTVKIGYIPAQHIIGLSKLARIVKYFSRRLNTQEYFTQNIANYIEAQLKPLGVGVVVTGRHLCREMRGIEKKGEMTTSCLKGLFLNQEVKEEFLRL